MIHTDGKSVT